MTIAATPSFLAPWALDTFFAEHWDQTPLAIHRNHPDYFRDVVDLEELDRLVTSARIPINNLNLARGDSPLPFAAYSQGSFVDQARVLALHREGATIILRAVEQWSPALNRLRIAAEELFQQESQINVYLTPASEKSTPPHWDTHDLIVLQIAGSKRWRLYEGRRTFPLSDEPFRIGQEAVSEGYREVVLHAGDTLYLPRGVIHEPIADAYSAHVSIGVHTVRVHDLLEVALRMLAAREGSPLRRTLTGWASGVTPALDARVVEELLQELVHPDLLEAAASELRRRFAASRRADLQGRLLDVARGPELAGETRYVRRAGVSLQATRTATGVQLAAGAEQISVGAGLSDAVEYITTHGSFTADELPGGRSSEERLALCVALQQIGVLRAERSAPAAV